MDSYEKLRKMSEISKQLKKHGLVSNSDEAIKQAEEMVSSGSTESDVYVSQQRYKSAMEAEKKKEADSMDKSTEIINALKNLNQSLNDRVAALNSDIGMIRTKMNEIISKINEIESKVGKDNRHEVQATLRNREESKPQIREEVKETKEDRRVKPESKEEYKPQDVAMDKVFYFGKR